MPIEHKFSRCEVDDPRRCQNVVKTQQCPFIGIEGTNPAACPMHAAGFRKAEEKKEVRTYNLTKWQNRVSQFADDDKVKSLREEVGIARLLLEEILNMCHSSTDLLMYSSKIADLVTRIEKLVGTCHRLETSSGMLLDKSAIVNLANVVVNIIGEHVTNAEVIDAISIKIVSAIVDQKPG